MEKGKQFFSSQIEEHKDKIYRICCYYLSDEEDRKDLYQEALLNIWKGFKTFRGDASFSTWMFRITVNTALKFLSKKRSQQQKTTQYADQLMAGNKIVENDGLDKINLLHKGISKLPLIDMIIISLVLEEVSSKEIAKFTGLTDNNVRIRIHRAKEALKKLIEGSEL